MRQIQIPWEKNACGIRDVAAGMKYKRIQIQKNTEEEKSITNVAAAGFDQSNASFHTGHTGHQQGWWRGSKFLKIQIQSIFKYKYKAIYF